MNATPKVDSHRVGYEAEMFGMLLLLLNSSFIHFDLVHYLLHLQLFRDFKKKRFEKSYSPFAICLDS